MVIFQHLPLQTLPWQAKKGCKHSQKPDTWIRNLPEQECPGAEGTTPNLLVATDWKVPPEMATFRGFLKRTTFYVHLCGS